MDSNPDHHVLHAGGHGHVQRHPHGADGRLHLLGSPGSFRFLPALEAGRHVLPVLLLLLAQSAGRPDRTGLFAGQGQGGQEERVNLRMDKKIGHVSVLSGRENRP